jgi:hypothetical protein
MIRKNSLTNFLLWNCWVSGAQTIVKWSLVVPFQNCVWWANATCMRDCPISRHSFYIGPWVKCLKIFDCESSYPCNLNQTYFRIYNVYFLSDFDAVFFFRFLIELSFSSMSTDLTTESSIYLSNNYGFCFLGPPLNQVSDCRLIGASSVISVSCL